MLDRPLRSLLYVPCSSPAMLARAGQRGADVLILDLEDGVLPAAKSAARETLLATYPSLCEGPPLIAVRVNSLDSPWGQDDLQTARQLRCPLVILPKAAEPGVVRAVAERLAPGAELGLMIETAAGVLAAAGLAALPRVWGVLLGAADLRESLRARRDPDELELLVARGQLLLAARATGVLAFDAPWFDYRDEVGLVRSAERARTLGFDGKTAVHPAQVAPINAAFAPSPGEIERAGRIVSALEAAAMEGRGVATLDGELIEALHARGARRVLAQARRLGLG